MQLDDLTPGVILENIRVNFWLGGAIRTSSIPPSSHHEIIR